MMIENGRKSESQIENNIKLENQDERRVESYRGGHWHWQLQWGFRIWSWVVIMSRIGLSGCPYAFA